MYRRRIWIFLALIAVVLSAYVLRLGQLQLVRGGEYAARVEESMRFSRLLATRRGSILDRHGRVLAVDDACYDFCLDYRALAIVHARRQIDPDLVFQWLATNDEDTRSRLRQQVRARGPLVQDWPDVRSWARRQARQIAAAEGLTMPEQMPQAMMRLLGRLDAMIELAAEVAQIPVEEVHDNAEQVIRRVAAIRQVTGTRIYEETQPHAVIFGLTGQIHQLRRIMDETVGAGEQPSTQRWYPYEDLACHIIGVTGPVTREVVEADPDGDDPLRKYLPGERLGISGVESLCEAVLRGARGRQMFHRNDPTRPLSRTEPVQGRDVRLTIDIDLQRDLTDMFRTQLASQGQLGLDGSLVVIDVPTGEILAMVSLPTYNLNTYREDYAQLVGDVRHLPLMHRAIARQLPPGSTVKIMTALLGLRENIVSTGTPIHCNVGDETRPRCWIQVAGGGHGAVELFDAIKKSCNAYFRTVGERLGAPRLMAGFNEFGLGVSPGTGLPGERAGLTPTPDWLMRSRQRVFWPSDGRMMAIGQGLLLATPLQIAAAMGTVARDGVYVSPRIVAPDPAVEPVLPERRVEDLGFSPADVAQVQRGMHAVVNERGGTAQRYFTNAVGDICGKTGTAQTEPLRIDADGDGRVTRDDPVVLSGNTAWFAGYASYRRPRIAFAVMVEYGGSGGSTAGPIAAELVRICGEHGYLD